MLYSSLAGFATYYIVLFVIGIFVNAMALEGELISLAVVCFIGAYLVHRYSIFVYRLAMGLGTIATVFLVVFWFILPLLAGTTDLWLIILSVVVALGLYLATRRRVFRHYNRVTSNGTRVAPPFGREWCRWLFIFMM